VPARPPEREFSAGGVVLRPGGDCIVIVPNRRPGSRRRNVLALPKGHVDPGEVPEQTAVREVREEAGVESEVVEHLGDVRYWYTRDGMRIAKVVRFFLLAHVSGEPAGDAFEVAEARWMPLEEAARRLSYDGERSMARKALERTRATDR
jgi:8-oxo-dGTP pyrophosphatase MutT (NUDIX family)